ncbi:hypothetical protein ACI2IY_09175 [Lysobacter enzymogenes]|uniref:hypothetical protein n=1 Tax=Lysobacter enzymogenes TaxID=69 RepID=UPI00384E541D
MNAIPPDSRREELERALDRLDSAVQAWIEDPPEREALETEFEDAVARVLEHADAIDYGYVTTRIRHSIEHLFGHDRPHRQ